LLGLEQFAELVSGVSTTDEGNMAEKWGDKEEVNGNRRRFLDKLGINPEDCVIASLSGGTKVIIVGRKDKTKYIEGDALITKEKGVGLFMVTADCLPVVMFDKTKEILSLVHLGWKGVDGKLAEKVIKRFCGFGSKPEDILVLIGPGVHKESYKWDPKSVMQKDKKDWKPFLEVKDGYVYVDVPGYVKKQLSDNGVREKNIKDCGIDTGVDKRYFSHYRSKRNGEPEGRFATVVIMKGKI